MLSERSLYTVFIYMTFWKKKKCEDINQVVKGWRQEKEWTTKSHGGNSGDDGTGLYCGCDGR